MKAKFILTVDTQRLAKWLRLLGYDSKVIKSISLLNLIRIADKENRLIISRSKDVLNHPLPFNKLYIHSNKIDKQLEELKSFLVFDEDAIFTRCPMDNEVLTDISKSKILNRIPVQVKTTFNEFKICKKCGRVYWKGSHYHKIKAKFEDLFLNNTEIY